jgi:DMSO/TMAO reductase YedYZ molybdopterin-dependent catalytic subunit
MPKREIEGDWILGWPDRKRPTIAPGKDAEGRVINGRAPVTDLQGLITPTDAYYIVNQLEVAEPVHPDDWSLSIFGSVERPFELDFDTLRKLPGRTVRAVTECAGNDAGYFDYLMKGAKKPSRINQQDMQKRAEQRVKGELPSDQEISSESTTTCAVSAGEFTGVPLREILNRAGIKSQAVCVRAEGFDAGHPDTAVIYRSVGSRNFEIPDPGVIHYEKALPLAKALDPDTIVAWAQNGEFLWHVHGAPVRLIVPGWSGNWWVKWLHQLEVMDTMPKPFYQTEYFVYGESAQDPNKPPIQAMGVRCIITEPLDEDSPLRRGSHMVRGLAWSGIGAIARVEVSLDDGKTWKDAHVEEPREKWLWARWSYLWEVDRPGGYRIMARATDETGRVQPQTPWNFQRKHFDWIVPTEITIVE